MQFLCLLLSLLVFSRVSSGQNHSEKATHEGYLNYETLTHTITLRQLRAGNHDSSEDGNNSYYFKVVLTGLIDEESQHILDFEKKKKLTEDYRTFGDLTLKTFKSYHPDDKGKNNISLRIEGDAIREIVRKSMNQLTSDTGKKPQESQIAVLVDVFLFIRKKKYFLINNDEAISQISYYALPFQTSDQKLYKNKSLTFRNERGLYGILEVLYQNSPDSEKK
ncbi:MAG: hypothetical protein H6618_05620 [Deltaproteobacteria bacterium]|nr:hypothetical protein [Deltaproteobacteria bacterium]